MNRFKRLTALVLVTVLCFTFCVAAIDVPPIEAGSYMILDRDTGKVLLENNADQRHYPASVTKLLTALIAVETLAADDVLTVEKSDIEGLYNQGSAVFLKPGEQVVFSELMKYFLIASGNDAANLIARHISGSGAAFATLMNEKAVSLGCDGSNFANPHGLHDDNHYTTAHDLALIAMAASKNPQLAEICATNKLVFPPTNMHTAETTFFTTNHLISRYKDNRYFYEGATGLKTGWTGPAGMCLAATATRGGLNILTVVMNAPKRPDGSQGSFTETTKLLDYAFSGFKREVFIPKTEPICELPVAHTKKGTKVILSLEKDYEDVLPTGTNRDQLSVLNLTDTDIKAPVAKGDVLGTATITYDGKTQATLNLVATEDVARSQFAYLLSLIGGFFGSKLFLILFGILVALLVILLVIRNANLQKRRKRRRGGRYGC